MSIKPSKDWVARRDWDKAAADTHKISPADLTGGLSPSQVAETLNAVLGPKGIANLALQMTVNLRWLNRPRKTSNGIFAMGRSGQTITAASQVGQHASRK